MWEPYRFKTAQQVLHMANLRPSFTNGNREYFIYFDRESFQARAFYYFNGLTKKKIVMRNFQRIYLDRTAK